MGYILQKGGGKNRKNDKKSPHPQKSKFGKTRNFIF
jgi:hypothetical protein